MTDVNYADDLALLEITSTQGESLLHRLEQAAGSTCYSVNTNKTEFMHFKSEAASH